MWFKRVFRHFLQDASQQRPAIVVTGARQTGKTSLLEKTFPNYGYVSLDIPMAAEQAEEAGQQFLHQHPAPLIVDEVQYAPGLFRYLKAAIDKQRDKNGQYVLTDDTRIVENDPPFTSIETITAPKSTSSSPMAVFYNLSR